MNRLASCLLGLALVVGCSTKGDSPVPPDASADVSVADGASDTAPVADAATDADAALPDATLPDATLPDATLPDATLPDATLPDATLPDASFDGGGEAVCTSNCARVVGCIAEATMDGCLLGCSMAIVGCSVAERADFEGCPDEVSCETYLSCTEAIPCLEP